MTLELSTHDVLTLNYILDNLLANCYEDDEDGGYFADPNYSLNEQEYETINSILKKL